MHAEMNGENVERLALSIVLAATAAALAPVARADMNIGNYDVQWSRPWDFHTSVLQISAVLCSRF